MRHRSLSLTSILLISLVTSAWGKVLHLPDGGVTQVETLVGVPKWHLYPHLWSYTNVNVSCPAGVNFEVYIAQDETELYDKAVAGETAWCGLDRLLSGHKQKCSIKVSPFETAHIGVQPGTAIRTFKSGSASCSLTASEQVSLPLIIAGIVGLSLFFNAGELSHSMSFRITTGSLTFMLLAVLVLAFLVARMTPNKKSMAAAFAFFGSSISGIVRYFFGRWVPSWQQLIYNKLVWAYVLLSGLSGSALTYYYDNEDNVKLLNILKFGLMLLGIGLVYCSTSMTEASLALCVLLLSSIPISVIWEKRKQRLEETWTESKQAGKQLLQQLHEEPILEASPQKGSTHGQQEPQPAFSHTPGSAGQKLPSRSGWRHPAQDQPLPGEYEASTPPPATFNSPLPPQQQPGTSEENVSPLIQRGKILNEVTGRVIKLHSATYNKLVANGYVVDKQNGVLTPPSKGVEESDDTDQDQPSNTPSQSARSKSRMSVGRFSRQ